METGVDLITIFEYQYKLEFVALSHHLNSLYGALNQPTCVTVRLTHANKRYVLRWFQMDSRNLKAS